MSIPFDPYYKWLGIPPDEQPPNHYRLLGVQAFESDSDVISNAADQRMSLLKTFAASDRNSLAEDLLNQVARARVCLLNPAKKREYDGALHSASNQPAPPTDVPPGFWLPPLDDITRSLEVACPRCEESYTYDLRRLPQTAACKSCNERMNLPGWEEVAKAATLLAQKPPASRRGQLDEGRATKAQRTRDSAPNVDLPPNLPFVGAGAPSYRRKKSRRSPFAALFGIILGGVMGLALGYFVLCVIDIRFDFLNLLAADNFNTTGKGAEVAPNVVPAPVPKAKIQPRAERRLPRQSIVRKNPALPEQQPALGLDEPLINEPAINRLPNPFSDLPLQFPLPVPQAVVKPISLAPVDLSQLDNFELFLLEGNGEGISQLSFKRVPPQWTWAVSSVNNGIEIASFAIVNNELQFAWSPDTNDLAVAALRNSILHLRANQRNHYAALRVATALPPLTFDLNKGVDHAMLKCADPPDINTMRVDILDLEDCPRYQVDGHALLGLKLNDQTIIHYADAEGATTRFRFVTVKDNPAIEVVHGYQLPSGESDTMNLTRGNRNLVSLRRRVAARNDPALRFDLESLERIAELATKLHDNVKLRYRVYFVIDQHEIGLATTP